MSLERGCRQCSLGLVQAELIMGLERYFQCVGGGVWCVWGYRDVGGYGRGMEFGVSYGGDMRY